MLFRELCGFEFFFDGGFLLNELSAFVGDFCAYI
jgi:hypothetical protein